MVGNGGGGRGTGINLESGGCGGKSTLDASIPWAKTLPTTGPPASINGESNQPGVSTIGCATVTLNASSFKGSGAGASEIQIETRSVIFVSPVLVMVAAAALYPPPPSIAVQRGSGVWILTILMLMVANFMYPPPRLNFANEKNTAPTRCSRLRPNLHLKDSANENYGFLVCSVAPRALGQ